MSCTEQIHCKLIGQSESSKCTGQVISIGDALVNSVHSQMTYRTHQQESQQNGTKTWDKTQTWTDKNGSDRMDLQLHIQDINIQMGPQGAGQTNIKQTNRNQIFTDPSVHISLQSPIQRRNCTTISIEFQNRKFSHSNLHTFPRTSQPTTGHKRYNVYHIDEL